MVKAKYSFTPFFIAIAKITIAINQHGADVIKRITPKLEALAAALFLEMDNCLLHSVTSPSLICCNLYFPY